MDATKRVALNTGILYARMVLTVGITLYTTRLVLEALGDKDYGIFNLIAGVILMLSFLNNAMATATQRFLSFYQGRRDVDMQKKVFLNSLLIHFIIAVFIVLLLELVGVFLFDQVLKIPVQRFSAAKIVYHYMSFTVFFTILAVPYNGSLIAHENMLWVAVINIFESLLKLTVAFLLFTVSGDKLVTYGLLTGLVSILVFSMYFVFCTIKYDECKISLPFRAEKKIAKELTQFAGWNLFGALCSVGKTQGVAVLLNAFFGVKVNAAYGISNQVSGQLNFFSGTMLRALNPQIMKSEGNNDRQRMIRLSLLACKYGFILLAIFAIPCIFEMEAILKFWLKKVPEFSVSFCTLILIAFMVNQITIGLDSGAQATGRIKNYMLFVGTSKLMIIPAGYIMLKMGFNIFSILYGYVFFEGLGGIFRVFILNQLVGLKVKDYLLQVIWPLFFPVFITVFFNFSLVYLVNSNYRPLILLPSSFFVTAISIYFLGMNKQEKIMFGNLIMKLKGKINKRKKYAKTK